MAFVDRAITVFSSDGQLLQVQYALEAARKGSSVVGVKGADSIVIATEKRCYPILQDTRVEKKMASVDDHILLAFAGLRADARVLITRARIEAQMYRLAVEEAVTVEQITKYIAGLKQMYTQTYGRRPFGVSCVIGGFDCQDGTPHLYQTEPSGMFCEWKAAATGRNDRSIRAFLEKNYNPSIVSSEDGCIKLALRALVETGRDYQIMDYDVAILRQGQPISMLPKEELDSLLDVIKKQGALNLHSSDHQYARAEDHK